MKERLLLFCMVVSTLGFAAECDDLSGEWTGSCVTNSSSATEDSIFVRQEGCAVLWLGDEKLEIGKSTEISKETEDFFQTTLITPEWASKSKLIVKFRANATVKTSGEKLFTEVGNLSTELFSRRLSTLLESTRTIFQSGGGTTIQSSKTECQYHKPANSRGQR